MATATAIYMTGFVITFIAVVCREDRWKYFEHFWKLVLVCLALWWLILFESTRKVKI